LIDVLGKAARVVSSRAAAGAAVARDYYSAPPRLFSFTIDAMVDAAHV
jgi:hypothetical protein